jgi:DNA-binding transcriptional ArsR family regulator
MSAAAVGVTYLKAHGAAAARDLARVMGVASADVSTVLRRARQAGVVLLEGAGKGRRYRISESFAGLSPEALRSAARKGAPCSNPPAAGAGSNRGSRRPVVSCLTHQAGAAAVAPPRPESFRAAGGGDEQDYFAEMLLGTIAIPETLSRKPAPSPQQQAGIDMAAAINRARGDATRAAALEILAMGETTCCAIGEALDLNEITIAQILRPLLGQGVERRKMGKMFWYRLAGDATTRDNRIPERAILG